MYLNGTETRLARSLLYLLTGTKVAPLAGMETGRGSGLEDWSWRMTMLGRQYSTWTYGRHCATRSLLLLLCVHGLVVLLFRTRSLATKQRTRGIDRDLSFETLQAFFRELQLSLSTQLTLVVTLAIGLARILTSVGS